MALFGKDEKVQRPDDVRPFVVGSPARAGEPLQNEEAVQAHLGKGSRIEGKLTFEASVRIDGTIEGEIQAQQAVIVGEGAVINAQINAETIVDRKSVV